MTDLPRQIEQAAALWRRARYVVALTGAGLSTASDIPDFRGPRGRLWSDTDPLVVASQETFRYAPEKFFAWVRPLGGQIRRAEPNAAHWALATLEARGRLHTVITQNIDGLHRRAGSQHLLEIHGSLHTATCVRCLRVWPGAELVDRLVADGRMPHCPTCGGLVKPNVTLIGNNCRPECRARPNRQPGAVI